MDLSGGAGVGCRFAEFADYRAGMLATLATFAGNTQAGPNFRQLRVTVAARFADLLVSNLAANTNVHNANFLDALKSKS